MSRLAATLAAGTALLLLPTAVPPAAASGTGGTAGTLTVVLDPRSDSGAAAATVAAAGGEVVRRIDAIGVLQVQTADTAAFLSGTVGRPGITAVSPSLPVEVDPARPSTESVPAQAVRTDPAAWTWGIDRVTGEGRAWTVERGSDEVVVGVIDTGLDVTHPDLRANVAGSRTFVPGTTSATDAHGHGTHVAGTIAADGLISGVAPGVKVRAYRALDAGGRGQTPWILEALVAAADDGVDVVNMSIGGPTFRGQFFYTDPGSGRRLSLGATTAESVAYQRAVRYAVSRGVTVVAAAGNSAQDITDKAEQTRHWNQWLRDNGLGDYSLVGATFGAPASLPGVVTVAATGGGFATPDRQAFYSNYGSGAIDLAAPGGDLGPHFPPTRSPGDHRYLVLSTVPRELGCSSVAAATFGDCRYDWAGGTSMASPHVAGVAALVVSQEYRRTGAKPSPATVTSVLRTTAEDLGRTGYDDVYGHGMVDAEAALLRH